jgi:Zn-dependent protease
MRLISIAGFQIRIDASWLFIASLLVWTLYSGVFADLAPGIAPATRLTMAVVAMLLLFTGLVLHELAHALVARRFGVKIGGITLFIFGGIAELVDEPTDARAEFWIAIAGPLASFALAALAYLVGGLLPASGAFLPLRAVLGYLATINVSLALFNLVPAFPLDGGRILRAALWRFGGNLTRATVIASRIGMAFAWLLILTGILSLFGAGDALGLWFVLIGMFLLNAAYASYSEIRFREHLGGRTVATLMTHNPRTVKPEMSLADLIDRVMISEGRSFLPVVDAGTLVGVIDAATIRKVDRSRWPTTTVREIMAPPGPENCIAADAAADTVLQHMARTGRRKLVVVGHGGAAGVITLADLLNYVSLLELLRPSRKTQLAAKLNQQVPKAASIPPPRGKGE